jgi:hypothetical protein
MPTPQLDSPGSASIRGLLKTTLPPAWGIDVAAGFLIALSVSLLSCQNGCNTGQVTPQGYSCGTNAGAGQPCLATVTYASGIPEGPGSFFPKLFGFRTTVAIPTSISAGDGRLGNSLRLESDSTNSFIEVGYYAVNTPQSISCPTGGGLLYWAAQNDNGTFIIDCLMPVPQGDIGQNVVLEISSLGSDLSKSSSFKVSISAPSQTINVCDPSFNIKCSTMLWNSGGPEFARAELGQTLVGSSGAMATTAAFVHNSFEVSDGVFAFETGESLVSDPGPPFLGVLQAASPGTQGGTFFTECCLAPATVFPGGIEFGDVPTGNPSSSQKVFVTNVQPSSGNLNISKIEITGTNASDFNLTNNCGGSLAPLASCTLAITFKPSHVGSSTAALTVTDSGGSGSGSDQATLTGNGK